MTLSVGTVCSGIGAPETAWTGLGFNFAFASEIEAFPRAVLKVRHPEIPLHGDFTTIEARDYAPIDALVGGTPCQSFSVAGLRGGLSDERGNLALEFLRLADRLRPRWLVWENVPGVFSATSHPAPDPREPEHDLDSDNGPRDGEEVVVEDEYDADEDHALACFLAGLSELGYGWAYGVLDAQYAGVPQRRRRIFVVGYLGDWRPPAAVLFERASLSGDPPPRRGAGEGAAHDVAPSLVSSGRGVERAGETRGQDSVVAQAFGGNNTAGAIDVATAVTAHGGPHGRCDFESETFIAQAVAPTLDASFGRLQGASGQDLNHGHGHLVAHAFDARQSHVIQYGDRTGPLDTDGHTMAICFGSKDHGADAEVELAPTLRAGGHDGSHANAGCPPAVAFALRGREGGAAPEVEGDGSQAGALRAASGGSSRDYVAVPILEAGARTGVSTSDPRAGAGIGDPGDPMFTLQAGKLHAVAFDTTQITCPDNRSNPQPGDPCHPVTASGDAPAVAFAVSALANSYAWESEVNPTLNATPPNDTNGLQYGIRAGMAVRRLTPRECERLQGFPDDYTLIPWRGGLAPDGPRYKALGNSMAVPVMRWIGERILAVEALLQAGGEP